MKDAESVESRVEGERDGSALARPPSLQSRVGNLFAFGLTSLLAVGMLAWYYSHAFTRQSRAEQSAKSESQRRAQGDLPLPSIGRIEAPLPAASSAPPPIDLPEVPLAPATTPTGVPPAKTPAELTLERQLAGAVFATQPVAGAPANAPSLSAAQDNPPGELAALLKPAQSVAVKAQVLPTQRMLLPKGAFLDCTLETAIDSTLPGMTTCILATDTFGANGEVVLLERGTKLVGETRGQVQQGAARVFVLWDEARTPAGVVVPLASPGADELGRAGLPGAVDRHFWQRFGAAMLVSVVDGIVQSAIESSRGNGSAVVVNPSATQDVMTEVLKNTIAIPPTVVKRQGDRIQVLVARDLDFRSVYELAAAR